jgi:hypothetical protein
MAMQGQAMADTLPGYKSETAETFVSSSGEQLLCGIVMTLELCDALNAALIYYNP